MDVFTERRCAASINLSIGGFGCVGPNSANLRFRDPNLDLTCGKGRSRLLANLLLMSLPPNAAISINPQTTKRKTKTPGDKSLDILIVQVEFSKNSSNLSTQSLRPPAPRQNADSQHCNPFSQLQAMASTTNMACATPKP